MTADDVGVLASALAVALTGVSLFFLGAQVRQAHRATSVAAARSFLAEMRTLWERCAGQEDHLGFQNCVGHILAEFELNIIAIRDGALTARGEEMIGDTIVEYLDKMAESNYEDIFREIAGKPKECKELKDFCLQRLENFRNREVVARMLGISSAAAS